MDTESLAYNLSIIKSDTVCIDFSDFGGLRPQEMSVYTARSIYGKYKVREIIIRGDSITFRISTPLDTD